MLLLKISRVCRSSMRRDESLVKNIFLETDSSSKWKTQPEDIFKKELLQQKTWSYTYENQVGVDSNNNFEA